MVGIIFMGQKYCVNNNSQTSEPVIFKYYCTLGNIAIKSNKPKQWKFTTFHISWDINGILVTILASYPPRSY
jgi:hypothetical protein